MKCSTSDKDIDPLCYLYQEYEVGLKLFTSQFVSIINVSLQITETPEYASTEAPTRSSPRISAFVGEEQKQYFVIVEQKVLCQVPSIQQALFIFFSAYYVFHLEYPKQLMFFYKIIFFPTLTHFVGQQHIWQQPQTLRNCLPMFSSVSLYHLNFHILLMNVYPN